MAKLSLQEQLLKAGLVSSAQAKAVKTEKHKIQKQQQKNKVDVVDHAKILAQQALEQKAQKDRELNLLQQAKAEHKAVIAQIKQLIEPNILPPGDEEIAYHFTEAKQVKTIYVAEVVRRELSEGRIAITRMGNRYVLITAECALKIKERNTAYFVFLNSSPAELPTSDPYAAYAIPDDLVW